MTAATLRPNVLNIESKTQKWCAWSGPAFVVLMLGGMSLAHMIPWGVQPHPGASAAQIGQFYRDHKTEIRLGSVLCIISQALYIPLGVLIALHCRRMERGFPIISTLQAVAVAACTAIGAPFGVFWALAAFRAGDAGASDETIRLFNDAGWIFFMIPLPVFTLWFLLIAIPICSKHNDESVFPRWVGYLNWLEVFGLLPVFLVVFFKHGAFGWNGALAFYFPLVLFCAWFIVMCTYLIKAANAAGPIGEDVIEPTARERQLDEVFQPAGAAS